MESQLKKIESPTLQSRRRTARPTSGGVLMTVLGLVLLLVATAFAVGGSLLPALEPYVARAVAIGVRADILLVGSFLAFGLAFVIRYQRLQTATLLAPGEAEFQLEQLRSLLGELDASIRDVRLAQQHSDERIAHTSSELIQFREELRKSGTKDSLFRLAASLDQLGARIDRRVGEIGSSLQDGLYELGSSVESSRDFVVERFQEIFQKIGTLSAEEGLASYVDELGDVGHASSPITDAGELDDPGFQEELNILVDLEDDDAGTSRNGGLGLLDEIGNDDASWASDQRHHAPSPPAALPRHPAPPPPPPSRKGSIPIDRSPIPPPPPHG